MGTPKAYKLKYLHKSRIEEEQGRPELRRPNRGIVQVWGGWCSCAVCGSPLSYLWRQETYGQETQLKGEMG